MKLICRSKELKLKNKRLLFSKMEMIRTLRKKDDFVFVAKNHKIFLKYGKNKRFGKNNTSISLKCYKYNKIDHIKKDCPNLQKEKQSFRSKKDKQFRKKKQGLQVTWDYSNSSSSSDSKKFGVSQCMLHGHKQ